MAIDLKRMKEICLEAAELADEAARAAYLDKACGADAGVRDRVEALLRSHDPDGSFLGIPAAVVPDPDHAATQTLAGSPRPAVAAAQTTGGENGSSHDEPLTFLTPSARPDALGRLGHYEVLQVLGRGGFGIVFRAFDEMRQRVVALKVLAPQLAATSPPRKRFLREARSAAQVRHENVVQVYEVAEQPLPYLAMEFIPGETLQQKLDRVGPLDVPEVLRIGRQIAEGLAAAHATDLIHRDIKPGNVLLEGGQHKVKITDFGLARAADDASISQSGIIAGTPMYMAPEQALGQTLDQLLYQMVAGRPPFRANSAVAVLKRVADDQPRAIREIIPETPQWLCDIIAKLHAKNLDDRYQSAREVADVLADCEAQLKANARLKDFSRIPRSKPLATGKSGRWKWAAAAALLLPILTLAVTEFSGVTHLLRGRESTPDPLQSVNRAVDKGPPPQNQQPNAAPLKYGDPEYTNTLGMKFKLIPAGKFTMGSSQQSIERLLELTGADAWFRERLPAEGPEHPVEITQPFYMGATEVTVGQFRQFVDEEGYQVGDGRWRNPGFDQTDTHPVVWLSWNNAVDFCKWLGAKEAKDTAYPRRPNGSIVAEPGKPGVGTALATTKRS